MNINSSLMTPAVSCTFTIAWDVASCVDQQRRNTCRMRVGLLNPQSILTQPRCVDGVHPQVARCLPWVVNNYKLEEITTVQELRRNCAKLFKLNANLRNPGVSTMSTRSCKLCTFKEYGSVRFDRITKWTASCRPWTCWCTRAERSSR
jgi:hypothetical protein